MMILYMIFILSIYVYAISALSFVIYASYDWHRNNESEKDLKRLRTQTVDTKILKMKNFVETAGTVVENEGMLAIYVSHPNYLHPEMIVNSYRNVPLKLERYTSELDDDLRLISNPSIGIVEYQALKYENGKVEVIG